MTTDNVEMTICVDFKGNMTTALDRFEAELAICRSIVANRFPGLTRLCWYGTPAEAAALREALGQLAGGRLVSGRENLPEALGLFGFYNGVALFEAATGGGWRVQWSAPSDLLATNEAVTRVDLVKMLRQAQGERDDLAHKLLRAEAKLEASPPMDAIERQARESIGTYHPGIEPPTGVLRVAMAKAHVREATDLLARSGLPVTQSKREMTSALEDMLGADVREEMARRFGRTPEAA